MDVQTAGKVPCPESSLGALGPPRYPAPFGPNLSMTTDQADPRLLDVTGLNCPMPLLKAKKALNDMAPGSLLKVLATDPGSVRDFEVFSRQSGNELLSADRDGETYVYLLRKKAG
jgi:tRNA 2-thiouridine synthesizing protein A